MLIACLHHAGLVTLTHTPSPMRFLSEILGPANERPFLPRGGLSAPDARVPVITKKALEEIATFIEAGSEAQVRSSTMSPS